MRTDWETYDWGAYLFRCSELANITSLGRGVAITQNQIEELDMLLSKIKLTEKQAARRDELIAKRDAPRQLSEGAKTFLKQRFLEVVTGRVKYMETKYTEKGTIMEYFGISMANRVLKWGLTDKQIDALQFTKKRVSNAYVTGEMDVNVDEVLADVKCPWNIHTFPFFASVSNVPSTEYFWQLQGYMMLTGKSEAELVYTLVDTPRHLITDEIRKREWKKGYIEMPDEEQEEIIAEMTYDDIPETLRVRRWIVQRDEDAQEVIKESVSLARNYLTALSLAFTSFNTI